MKNQKNQKNPVILQIPFNTFSNREAALNVLLGFLEADQNHLVVTPNPEAVMIAQRDGGFLHVLQQADLVLPDAIGILMAAKWLKMPMPCRVPGCDAALALLEAISTTQYTVYLLGAAPGVAETALRNLEASYPTLRIIGTHDGYFNHEEEILLLEEIKQLKPDVLLVGMSMPRQELWAATHLHNLPCKVTMCLGGSIDIMAGTVKRAPKIMRRLGLEWLYRLVSQPSRARRMLNLPRFVLAVLRSKRGGAFG